MSLMQWLNTNSAAITAIATVVLVILTFFYAAFTWGLLRANQALTKAGTEPDVVAYITPDQRYLNMMNLVIANVGRGPARNVVVQYIADFEDLRLHRAAAIFEIPRKIASVLPQDDRITVFFGSVFDLLGNSDPVKEFTINVSYQNTAGRLETNSSGCR